MSQLISRTGRSAAVVGDDVVDKLLLDVGLDGDEISSVISTAAHRRLGQLQVTPVDDVARADAVDARREIVRTEACLHRRCN